MHRSGLVRLPARATLAAALSVFPGIAVLGLAQPAHAATTITVSSCSESALDAAVAQANSDNAGDTINFGCSGTITLTSTLDIAGSMTIDGSGQQVTLDGGSRSSPPGVQVLNVASGVTFTLNDTTIADGFTTGSGGGLYNDGGTVTIADSAFTDNYAGVSGGAMENFSGTVNVTGTTFHGNRYTGGEGGAINNGHGATMTIADSTFAQNSQNVGDGSGGAIANAGGMSISASYFTSNEGLWGGAVYQIESGGLSIVNSSFFDNSAEDGGAIYARSGSIDLAFSTLFGNSAGAGPSLYTFGGTVNVVGSILADGEAEVSVSPPTEAPGNCGSAGSFSDEGVNDQGYNMETGTDCGFTGTGDLQNASPLIGHDSDGALYLEQGSPGIDAVPLSLCPSTDENGNPRPDDPSETACDMGAVESDYQPALIVSSSQNPSPDGQPVTITAVVPATDGGGTVSFYYTDGPAFCSGQPLTLGSDGSYSATCTFTPPAPGNIPITATYSGDTAYPGVTSGDLPGGQTVSPPPDTTSVSSAVNPSAYGQPATFFATVTPSDGGGTVAFYADGSTTPIAGCSAQPLSLSSGSYVAECATSALAAGTHAISATFSGDAAYPSSSGTLAGGQTVSPVTTLTSSADPSPYGQSVTFTATVTPTDGGGTVAFYADGSTTPISGCSAQSLTQVSGSTYAATCSTSALPGGTHAITASYSGDSSYPSSSASLAGGQTVSLSSAPIVVGTCDESVLDNAIAQANAANDGETVTFDCSGTIDLTSTLDITGSMTLDGTGQQVTLDGQADVQVLNVASGVTFTLNDMTIADGSGGLFDNGGTVNIVDSTFSGNLAETGGAVESLDGTVSITGSTFTANRSATDGSAGAVNNDHGTLTVADSTFVGNVSGADGGAIESAGALAVAGSAFFDNRSGDGGAIYVSSTGSSITNSSFYENAADTDGGAVFDQGASNIGFSTFDDNSASAGGALYAVGTKIGVLGSILAGPDTCGGDVPVDLGYDMETGTDCGFTGTGDLQNASPLISIEGNQVLYLLQGSPGIDAVPLALCPSTDEIGNPRPDDPSETTCDMGAVESDYPPAAVLTSSADPSQFGQPVTITATVPSTDGGGAVAFFFDGAAISGCTAQPLAQDSAGSYLATCTFTPSSVGNFPVTAAYSGDAAYPSTTGSLSGGQTVDPATTTTALSSSPNPSDLGQAVTFTATVTPTDGTGTVAFYLDGSPTAIPVCDAQPLTEVSSGTYTATCTITSLQAGNHTMLAAYSGDTDYAASSGSLPGGQTVNPVATATSVASSLDPSTLGQAVTFTATVTPTDGGGTVAFYADGSTTPISGCDAQPLVQESSLSPPVVMGSGGASVGYSATCTTSALAIGTHAIVATYSGDSDYNGSSGSLSGSQTVNSVTTGTSVSSSADPSIYGNSVMFTATVTGSDGGGTVAFYADGSTTPVSGCASQLLTASAGAYVATCATSALTAGTHAISASYSGDSNYDGSSGALSGGQVVDPASLAVDVTGAQTYGGSAAFTVAGYSGFVNGDTASVVSGTLTGCMTSVTSAAGVGTYFGTISACTGLSAANYTISYVDAGVTVAQAPLVAHVAGTQTYGGTPVFAVAEYTGLVNGDTASVVTGALTGCKTSVTPATSVGSYAGTISGCSGLSSPNYAITYADAGVTVTPAHLTITASSGSMTYGATPPAITPAYSGFVNGDSAGSLTTAPSCSTTATSASPVGSYPSSCAGATDPNYTIGYVGGQVTVGQAGTTLTYTGPESISAGTELVPAATLTSPASACQSGQQITFTLNANPATGVAGTYTLESATTGSSGTAAGASVSTTGWQAGAYAITASYAGTANCAAATVTEPLAVTVPGLAAAGAGGYTVTGAGTVGFGFIVAQVPHTSLYLGAMSLINNGTWELTGTITSYVMTSSTQGTLAGTGSLSWWNPALNNNRGGWQLAKSGVAFTASFGATSKTSPGSFGIKISYTPAAPQPSVLPNSSPVSLSTGAIVIA